MHISIYTYIYTHIHIIIIIIYLLTGNSYRKNNSSICTYDLKFPIVHTDLV